VLVISESGIDKSFIRQPIGRRTVVSKLLIQPPLQSLQTFLTGNLGPGHVFGADSVLRQYWVGELGSSPTQRMSQLGHMSSFVFATLLQKRQVLIRYVGQSFAHKGTGWTGREWRKNDTLASKRAVSALL
jgi:hypothetical protein